MRVFRLAGWALCVGAALALPGSRPVAASAAAGAPLVFCADPGYMPYSDRSGDGFENRIASVVGRALGRPIHYYWRSMRLKDEYGEFITATIQAKKCDVLVDVPYALQQVKTTRPYFISSYVFVYKKARNYDVTSLDSPQLRHLKIGYEGDTPVDMGLKERTLVLGAKLFLTADDEDASPQAIVDAVESNKIDVGMSWDPAVAYYLKGHPDLTTVAIPNSRSQGYPEQYTFPMAMATRTSDTTLNADLNRVIATHASELDAVLRSYNITFTAPSADSGL
jgi:mxaJ protein